MTAMPECTHAPRRWSPVIIFRAGPRVDVKSLIPIEYCDACTETLTVADFITDQTWEMCRKMLVRHGAVPDRSSCRLRWERSASVVAQFQEAKVGVFDSETAPLDDTPAQGGSHASPHA